MNVDHSEHYPPMTADTISASKTLKPVILFVYFNTVFCSKNNSISCLKNTVFFEKTKIFRIIGFFEKK